MRFKSFRIGAVEVDPPTVLAPMAGITDAWFRKIVKSLGGVGLVTMEFISSESLTRDVEKTRQMMAFAESERPISIQIYGSKPGRMADAARRVEEIGADLVDINMGCPAKKILKGCAGAALMGDLVLARRIISAVRKAVDLPVTVKFRTGLDPRRENYLELGRICQEEGADAVALHGRTAKQGYRGQADWMAVGRLVENLRIPVMGNGDVSCATDAFDLVEKTGCAGVMIGRAALKNPWIFLQIKEIYQGAKMTEPTWRDRRDLILRHFQLLKSHPDRRFVLHKIRTFTGWYSKGIRGGAALRRRLSHVSDPTAFLEEIREFFHRLQASHDQKPVVPLIERV